MHVGLEVSLFNGYIITTITSTITITITITSTITILLSSVFIIIYEFL